MRLPKNTPSKRFWLPFALCLALVLPAGARAGVMQAGDDAALKIPTTIFGSANLLRSPATSFDGHDDKDKEKDKEKKDKDDGTGEQLVLQPQPPPPPAPTSDEDPSASWSG